MKKFVLACAIFATGIFSSLDAKPRMVFSAPTQQEAEHFANTKLPRDCPGILMCIMDEWQVWIDC